MEDLTCFIGGNKCEKIAVEANKKFIVFVSEELICKVPISKWKQVWHRLSIEPNSWLWIDEENLTALSLDVKIMNQNLVSLEVYISIKNIDCLGVNYSTLNKLTQRLK